MSAKPGVIFLLRTFPHLLVAPGVVLALDLLRRRFLDLDIPIWVLILIYLLSWPLQLFIIVQWHDFVTRMEARKRGAQLPPVIKLKSFGNYESIKHFEEMRAHGYLGASIQGHSLQDSNISFNHYDP